MQVEERTAIRVEVGERVATITLDRPERMNAASLTLFGELTHALGELAADPDVRAVVLTGAGPHFCAGMDIEGLAIESVADTRPIVDTVQRTFVALERFPKPLIAAVRGYALGGGLEITLPCDIVLASDSARFGLPEIRLGLMPAMALLRGSVLTRRGLVQLALTGERIDAERARELGLCTDVVADAALDGAAAELAGRLAETPPLAVEAAKRILHAGAEDGYAQYAALIPGLLLSEDLREGRAAFEQRRPPVFAGR